MKYYNQRVLLKSISISIKIHGTQDRNGLCNSNVQDWESANNLICPTMIIGAKKEKEKGNNLNRLIRYHCFAIMVANSCYIGRLTFKFTEIK